MLCPFQRARAPEQKADRRAHLLCKAAELFEAHGEVPTAAELSKAANVAKGTVYLYFHSKQEIFLALLEAEVAQFFDAFRCLLSAAPLRSGDEVSSALIRALHQCDKLLPLAVMGPRELEQNASDEALLRYKQLVAEKMGGCAAIIASLPEHTPESAQKRLTQGYALIIGLHQLANCSPRLTTLFKSHGLAAMVPEFWPALEDALIRLWKNP